jgi:uncharacterized membrane protein YkoI
MNSLRQLAGALVLLLAAGVAGAATFGFSHAPEHPWMIAQRDHARNGGLSLDEAINRARRRHDGKVLSADTVGDNGNKEHRIRILTPDGRVKRFRMDAGNGKNKKKNRR